MAFPGHFKSVQLNKFGETLHAPSPSTPSKPCFLHPNHSLDHLGIRSDIDRNADGFTSMKENKVCEMTDDKGNRSTRSLWIGDVPPELDSSHLRAAFARYGPIESVKIPPRLHCAFVDFEKIGDAIIALRECHNTELFKPSFFNCVRFTATPKKVKKRKEQNPNQNGSFSKTCEPQKRKPSQGSVVHQESNINAAVWPNGPPPTGPKSRRQDVSPPPLRKGKGDSYRPSERSEHSSRSRRVSRRLTDDQGVRRGHDIYRPAYGDASRAAESSDSQNNIPYFGCNVPDIISGPGPAQQKQMPSCVSERSDSVPYSPPAATTPIDRGAAEVTSPSKEGILQPRLPQELSQINGDRGGCADISDERETPVPNLSIEMCSNSAPNRSTLIMSSIDAMEPARNLEASLSASNEALSPAKKSRMLSPLQRLRQPNDDACSVASDLTTSSKSSSRKRCADCKKSESSMTTLISCLTCPRRYHSSCGDPRPSLGNTSAYICGRCTKKQSLSEASKTNTMNMTTSKASVDLDMIHVTRKDHPCMIPQVDGSNEGVASLVDIKHQTSRVSTEPPLFAETRQASDKQSSVLKNLDASYTNSTLPMGSHHGSFSATATMQYIDIDTQKSAQQTKKLYKTITCLSWKKDHRKGCSLAESVCLFAHRDTGSLPPDGLSSAKRWTCYKWFSDIGCPFPEYKCRYAHKNTPLHVGIDGEASKKHITCQNWHKFGICKYSETECLYTHRDTGIYAHYSSSTSRSSEGDRLVAPKARLSDGPISIETCQYTQETSSKKRNHNSPFASSSDIVSHSNTNVENEQVAKYGASGMDRSLQLGTNPGSFPDMEDSRESVDSNEISTEVNRHVVGLSRNSSTGAEAAQDPRKQKLGKSMAPDGPKTVPRPSLHLNKHTTIEGKQGSDVDGNSIFRKDAAPSTNAEAKASSQVGSTSRRKCTSCKKVIFNGGETCVGCSKSSLLAENLTVDPLTRIREDPPSIDPSTEHSIMFSEQAEVNDTISPEVEKNDRMFSNSSQIRHVKRKSIEGAMFVSNKRPRPNHVLGAHRSLSLEKPKSIEELTREGIEKKMHAQTPVSDMAAEILSPSNDSNKENEKNSDSGVSSYAGSLTDAETTYLRTTSTGTSEPYILKPLDLIVPSDLVADTIRATSASQHSVPLKTRAPPIDVSGPSEGLNRTQDAPQDDQDFQQQDDNESDNDVVLTYTQTVACRDCSRKHTKCPHFNNPPRTRSNITNADVPRVCDICRKKHKKCLHKADGTLDGKKCLEWNQSRGRNNSDRSKADQIEIDEAADEYMLNSVRQQSRGTSVSNLSEHEISPLYSGDGENSTAATTDTESESDMLETMEVDKPQCVSLLQPAREVTLRRQTSLSPTKITTPTQESTSSSNLSAAGIQKIFGSQAHASNIAGTITTDERRAIRGMNARGVTFESDGEDETEIEPIPRLGQLVPTVREYKRSKDPLHQYPKVSSKNLYDLYPLSNPNQQQETPFSSNHIVPRITKGQGLKNSRLVLRRALQRNYHVHGNKHSEVDRKLPEVKVEALIEKTIAPTQDSGFRDSMAPELVLRSLQSITFREFLGVSGDVEPCLIGKGSSATLAFKRTVQDQEKEFMAFSRRCRNSDGEKWPVYDK